MPNAVPTNLGQWLTGPVAAGDISAPIETENIASLGGVQMVAVLVDTCRLLFRADVTRGAALQLIHTLLSAAAIIIPFFEWRTATIFVQYFTNKYRTQLIVSRWERIRYTVGLVEFMFRLEQDCHYGLAKTCSENKLNTELIVNMNWRYLGLSLETMTKHPKTHLFSIHRKAAAHSWQFVVLMRGYKWTVYQANSAFYPKRARKLINS